MRLTGEIIAAAQKERFTGCHRQHIQTWSDFEFIIVDDGSAGHSIQILNLDY